MVKEILTDAGFIEGKTFIETRFLQPPRDTFVTYMDTIEATGSDDKNRLIKHDYMLEVYSYKPIKPTLKRLESILNSKGIPFTKQSTFWINEAGLFQTIYEFELFEKL